MADNALKTPLGRSLNEFALRKVQNQVQIEGKSLPCRVVAVSNTLVTVAFEVTSDFTLPNVTVPQAYSRYVRLPTQVGDLGIVRPIDTYLGGVSGLGGGTANLTPRANLAALVYEPVSAKGWPAVDPNAVVVSAPHGVVLRDDANSVSIIMHDGTITVTGHLVINGKSFLAHDHTGVQPGSGTTGGVGP